MSGKTALAIVLIATAMAQAPSRAQTQDPRIQIVDFDPLQVTTVPIGLGFATVIELGPEERVESLVVGDSGNWQVTASKRRDHVVVKPVGSAAPTDLVIITASRSIVFQLQPSSGFTPYLIRLRYPGANEPVEPMIRATYSFGGRRSLYPVAMHDDGRQTIIVWDRSTRLPAVFAVESNGRERLVNGRFRGAEYLVDEVAPRFVFRLDRAQATAKRKPVTEPRAR